MVNTNENARSNGNGCFIGLWINAKQDLPENLANIGWCRAYNAWEALTKLELMKFEEIIIDYDLNSFLGNKKITGYDILSWLVTRKQEGCYTPPKIIVNSLNKNNKSKMTDMINQYLI